VYKVNLCPLVKSENGPKSFPEAVNCRTAEETITIKSCALDAFLYVVETSLSEQELMM